VQHFSSVNTAWGVSGRLLPDKRWNDKRER
jgi:hypothetical protein